MKCYRHNKGERELKSLEKEKVKAIVSENMERYPYNKKEWVSLNLGN